MSGNGPRSTSMPCTLVDTAPASDWPVEPPSVFNSRSLPARKRTRASSLMPPSTCTSCMAAPAAFKLVLSTSVRTALSSVGLDDIPGADRHVGVGPAGADGANAAAEPFRLLDDVHQFLEAVWSQKPRRAIRPMIGGPVDPRSVSRVFQPPPGHCRSVLPAPVTKTSSRWGFRTTALTSPAGMFSPRKSGPFQRCPFHCQCAIRLSPEMANTSRRSGACETALTVPAARLPPRSSGPAKAPPSDDQCREDCHAALDAAKTSIRFGPQETALTPSEGMFPPRSYEGPTAPSPTFDQCQRWVFDPTAKTSRRPGSGRHGGDPLSRKVRSSTGELRWGRPDCAVPVPPPRSIVVRYREDVDVIRGSGDGSNRH